MFNHASGILSSTQESGSSHSESSSGLDLGGTLATSSDHENSDADLPDPDNAPQTPHEFRMPMQADRLPTAAAAAAAACLRAGTELPAFVESELRRQFQS